MEKEKNGFCPLLKSDDGQPVWSWNCGLHQTDRLVKTFQSRGGAYRKKKRKKERRRKGEKEKGIKIKRKLRKGNQIEDPNRVLNR